MKSATVRAALLGGAGVAFWYYVLMPAGNAPDAGGMVSPLFFLLAMASALYALFGGYFLEKHILEETRRQGCAAFEGLGIPARAVLTVVERGWHFFGVAIDKKAWMLYLLDCPNVYTSPMKTSRIQQIPIDRIRAISRSYGTRNRYHQEVLAQHQGITFSRDDVHFSHGQTTRTVSTRHPVGLALNLHLMDGSTTTFQTLPWRRIGQKHRDQAINLYDKVKEAVDAHCLLYPRPEPPPPPPPPPPKPDPLKEHYIF